MRLLRTACIIFIITSMFSCKSQGPLTPEEAYNNLKNACAKANAGEMEKLLSGRSIKKIESIIQIISAMNDAQLKSLGNKFGIDAGRLKGLSVKDYLYIQLSGSRPDDVLAEIAKNNIIGVDVVGNKAVVRVENGMEFIFIKEGPYWKFDMEELSAGN